MIAIIAILVEDITAEAIRNYVKHQQIRIIVKMLFSTA